MTLYFVVPWLFVVPSLVGEGSGERTPRRVFALHSGVHIKLGHPDKNYAAQRLRRELFYRDVPDRDLVVLDCPFPEAKWTDIVPRDGVRMFLDSVSPQSRVAHDAYRCLHETLVARGVGADDEIVWVGHSAGGQMGLTLAHLAAHLADYPELAKSVKRYRFHTIITLGTPLGRCDVPDDVRVFQYFSPQDRVVRLVCDGGPWVLPSWGYPHLTLRPCSPSPGKNCLVRCWFDVEHPDWFWRHRVLDRILQDGLGTAVSPWEAPLAVERPGVGLVQLLCRALESQYRLSIEELPDSNARPAAVP